jgi:hypothetical protein
MRSIVVAVLLCLPVFAQNGSQSNRSEMIKFAVKSAVSAVNFKQGDLVGFNSARAELTEKVGTTSSITMRDSWIRTAHRLSLRHSWLLLMPEFLAMRTVVFI